MEASPVLGMVRTVRVSLALGLPLNPQCTAAFRCHRLEVPLAVDSTGQGVQIHQLSSDILASLSRSPR